MACTFVFRESRALSRAEGHQVSGSWSPVGFLPGGCSSPTPVSPREARDPRPSLPPQAPL